MFPEEFERRLETQEYIDKDSLLKALGETAPVSIRINPSKWTKSPYGDGQVDWCNTGYYLKSRPSFTLDPLFHSGCYYPQEASSMFLSHLFRQPGIAGEGIRVLDLCAAPGGKSTHLSQLMGRGSLLVANEVIRSRAAILSETLTKWGATNAIVTQNDPADFSTLPGYFDIILIDAPCSGEGMFRSETARTEWSLENAGHCSDRQKRILMDVWPALREGGYLIYSTCTFNPAENEDNIKWLSDKQRFDSVKVNLDGLKGITEIVKEDIFGYGFHPGKIRGDGLFFSVLKKSGETGDVTMKREKKVAGKIPGPFVDYIETITKCDSENLVMWGNEIVSLACASDNFDFLQKRLRIVKAGTRLVSVKNRDLLPLHELVLSGYLKESAYPSVDVDLVSALRYLKRDITDLSNTTKGWNLLTYNGVNLGFINNIGKRINNYYPVDWRIRMNVSYNEDVNIIDWNEQ